MMAVALASLLAAGPSIDSEPTVVALIIGVNTSVDPALKPLRYADDDAARYAELFETLGAQVFVLARLDEGTARVHPAVAQRAVAPTDRALDEVVERTAHALAAASGPTVLFVIYAGHGSLHDGQGALALEDAQLSTQALDERLFQRLRATHTHFIVDACSSSFLALARGPGGRRAAAQGFSDAARLGQVGLLLSTASARESHEWEGFQAGVFSHELRSGLAGAADANGDGEVSYRELAAFVETANASIVNDRYRPDAYLRAPPSTEVVLSLRGALRRRLVVPAAMRGHFLLEDTRGVRLLDVHHAGTPVALVRPRVGQLYLRRADVDDREWVVPEAPDVIEASALTARPVRVASRGAAADAFASTFARPFGEAAVLAWRPPTVVDAAARTPWRTLGWVGLGVGGAASVVGGVLAGLEVSQRARLGGDASQRDVAALNAQLLPMHDAWVGLFIAGGLALTAGLVALLVEPPESLTIAATFAPGAAGVMVRWAPQ